MRRWAEKNREYLRAKGSEYSRANRPKMNAKMAKRRAIKRNAKTGWACDRAIRAIYEEARRLTAETGIPHDVDHTVPIVHPLVAGLHVPANLRIIPRIDNQRKGNRHWPDMPD